jgi:hypothetical protein
MQIVITGPRPSMWTNPEEHPFFGEIYGALTAAPNLRTVSLDASVMGCGKSFTPHLDATGWLSLRHVRIDEADMSEAGVKALCSGSLAQLESVVLNRVRLPCSDGFAAARCLDTLREHVCERRDLHVGGKSAPLEVRLSLQRNFYVLRGF